MAKFDDITVGVPEPVSEGTGRFDDIDLGTPSGGGKFTDIDLGGDSTKPMQASAGEKFAYGFATMPSFTSGIGDYLERRFPMGQIRFWEPGIGFHMPKYVPPPSELVAAAEQKNHALAKQIMDERAQYEIQSVAPNVTANPEQQGGAAEIAGNVAAVLLDPTTLIPVTKAAKLAYATAGTVGAADAAAYGLALDDKIDPTLTMVGAVGGVAGLGVVRYAGGKLSRFMQSIDQKSAEKVATNFEHLVVKYRDDGMDTANAYKAAKSDMTLNEDAIAGLTTRLGRKLDLRRSMAEADTVVEEAKTGLRNFSIKNKIGDVGRYIRETSDPYLGTLSTRVKNISPTVWGRLRKLDFNEHHNTHEYFKKAQPFLDSIKSLKRQDNGLYKALHKSLLNQDKGTTEQIVRKMGNRSWEQYKEVRGMLDNIGGQMKDVGYKMDLLEDFFPRVIKDLPKLMKALGSTERAALEKNARAAGIEITNPEEMGAYINQHMRGRLSGSKVDQVLGTSKARRIDKVSDTILEHYAEPAEAMHSYLRRTAHDIERRKFFGRGTVNTSGGADVRIAESVGNLIAVGRESGEIAGDQVDELRDLLTARFNMTNTAGSKIIQDFRNVAYMSTIGNPLSAVTQLGDIGVSAFAHGVRNTLRAVFGKKFVDMEDLGLLDIAQEFSSTRKTAKVMESVFKVSGFKAIDKLGKNTAINSSLRKWFKQAKTPKGVAQMRAKFGPVLGDEFDSMVNDLNSGNISPNVKMMLFSELADMQPISLSEMPQKYLENPNGRVFYMLKTFTLKQFDIMRREIWNQAKTGNKAKAAANAVRYFGLITAANTGADMIKESLLTGEVRMEDVDDKLIWNVFKNFGASEYLVSQAKQDGDLFSLLGSLAAPPMNVGDGLFHLFTDTENFDKHMKHMPVIGKFWYYYVGDGLNDQRAREERKLSRDFNEEFDF